MKSATQSLYFEKIKNMNIKHLITIFLIAAVFLKKSAIHIIKE